MAAESGVEGVLADAIENLEGIGDAGRLPFPLKTTTGAIVINDNHTDIVITEFENKFLIVATQYEKLGTMRSCRHSGIGGLPYARQRDGLRQFKSGLRHLNEAMLANREVGQGDDAIPVYNVSTILGKDDPEIHVFGRMLAEKLNVPKPIVLGLAMKEITPSTTKSVVEQILTLIAAR